MYSKHRHDDETEASRDEVETIELFATQDLE
jgi:hypothetical protein